MLVDGDSIAVSSKEIRRHQRRLIWRQKFEKNGSWTICIHSWAMVNSSVVFVVGGDDYHCNYMAQTKELYESSEFY